MVTIIDMFAPTHRLPLSLCPSLLTCVIGSEDSHPTLRPDTASVCVCVLLLLLLLIDVFENG